MTTFALTDGAAHEEDADALVVFAAPGTTAPRLLGGLRPRLAQAIGAAAATVRLRGSADEVAWLTHVPGVAAGAVLVVGVGGDSEQTGATAAATIAPAAPTTEELRRAAGTAGRALAGRASAAVVLPDEAPETAGAVTEGLGYGSYVFTAHRGTAAQAKAAVPAPVGQVRLLGAGKPRAAAAARATVSRAEALVEGVGWARDLVNTAPNVLFPESFAERVREQAPTSVAVQTYDAAALAELGCGGILGVGQGSMHPPVLVRMSYTPKAATARLAYVGKGITFDSGGLSLKSPPGMITMKGDMGGAAAVAAAILTIARLGLPVAVEGWLCLAENMPDGRAQRPGDVVTMADGTTCEIINTDAEGRLVLADGLVLASRERPDAIVDIATLTGSAVVALGHRTAAVLANDDDLQAEVTTAATAAGESVWPMPIPAELTKGLKSGVADRKHAAEREGGALFAAAFLREYVGRREDGRPIPWGHLDIAGPAYNEKGVHGYTGKGGTGFGTRTLVTLAEFRS